MATLAGIVDHNHPAHPDNANLSASTLRMMELQLRHRGGGTRTFLLKKKFRKQFGRDKTPNPSKGWIWQRKIPRPALAGAV